MHEQMMGVILKTFDGEQLCGQLPTHIVAEEGLLNYNEKIYMFNRYDLTNNIVIFEEVTSPYKITEKFT